MSDLGVWNDDAWKRICQLVDRLELSLSPHQSLREYVSELEVKMNQPVHDFMFLDDRLKWLEYLADHSIVYDYDWNSTNCFRLERLEMEWDIPLNKKMLPIYRLENLEDFIGKGHPTEESLDCRLHALEVYPYWAVQCIHDCEQLEKSWGIQPQLPASLSERVKLLEQIVGRPPATSDYGVRINQLTSYPIEIINCFKRIKKLEDIWGIDPRYSNAFYPFRLHERISELEKITGQSVCSEVTLPSSVEWFEQRLSKLESIKRSDEKMSDTAHQGQSYTQWRNLCDQRILGLVKKWELDPPNSDNLLEARLDSLEFQLGLELGTKLDIADRLDRLEKVTPDHINAMKQVKYLENKWGIASYVGQSLQSRVDRLELFKNVRFDSGKPIQEKIEDFMIMARVEDNHLDTCGNMFQEERDDSMLHEGIILGPNPTAIPVHESKEGFELESSKITTKDVSCKHLDNFKKLLDGVDNVPSDMKNILELLPYLLKLQLQKSAVYGRSYCRHGDLSIFLNTERKWDRISNIMDTAMKDGVDFLYSDKAGTATETFLDTVVDLASYALLWVGYIKETHPEAFQKFLEDNKLS